MTVGSMQLLVSLPALPLQTLGGALRESGERNPKLTPAPAGPQAKVLELTRGTSSRRGGLRESTGTKGGKYNTYYWVDQILSQRYTGPLVRPPGEEWAFLEKPAKRGVTAAGGGPERIGSRGWKKERAESG